MAQPAQYSHTQYQHQQQQQQSFVASPIPAATTPSSSSSTPSNDPADLLLAQFPSTSKLTREDLDELLRNPAYFDAFAGTLPQVAEMEREHEECLRKNQELAESNMALREEHERLKAETMAAFNEAKDLQAHWEHLSREQDEAYKRFAPPIQLSRLRTALNDQDRLSEQLVASFTEGNLDMDEFARQFKEVRRLFYRRNIQTEKWLAGQVDWRD